MDGGKRHGCMLYSLKTPRRNDNTDIQMGNDEFILYIRKNGRGVSKSTAELGKSIWKWLQAHAPGATIVASDQPCRWGDTGAFISMDDLPKTATQFSFDRLVLPRLYEYLDTL